MGIKANLITALSLVIVVMLATVGYLGWSSLSVNRQLSHITPAVAYLESIAVTRAGVTRQMKELFDCLLTGSATAQEEFNRTGSVVDQGFDRWLAAIRLKRQLGFSDEKDELRGVTMLRERYSRWEGVARHVMSLSRQGYTVEARKTLATSSFQVIESTLLTGIDDAFDHGILQVETEFHFLVMALGRLPWAGNDALLILERTQATVDSVIAVSKVNAGLNKQVKELMNDMSLPTAPHRPFGWSGNETQAALGDFRRSAHLLMELGDPNGTRLVSEYMTLDQMYRQFTLLCQQAMSDRQAGNLDKAANLADEVIDQVMREGFLPDANQTLAIGSSSIRRLSSAVGWQGMGIVIAGALLVIGALVASLHGILRTFATLEKGTSAITTGDLGHRIDLPTTTELGRLAASFNTMTDTLQKSHADLQQLNAELEQRVQERTAQLAAANADLRLFSSSVCHDLRTPLSAIGGFSQLLLLEHGDSLSAPTIMTLQQIAESTAEMSSIIDALMKLGRISEEEIDSEPVDLNLLATVVIAELRNSDPGRQTTVEIEDNMIVPGDERLLHLMLENLLSNAWKFTAQREEGKIVFGSRREGSETVYFVRDNGAGFDMARAEALFKPFKRLHRDEEFSGTGIGLATVQRIVARHGGRIWAEGIPDGGATFYFTLSPPTKEA